MTKQEIINELRALGVVVDETATNAVLLAQLSEAKKNPASLKNNSKPEDLSSLPPGEIKAPETPKVKMVQISETAWKDVQDQLKMLKEVADKGRVFNYENNQPQKKAMKIKLSVFTGKVIVGWRTLKDELIKHPTSGLTVGEKQEYELKLLAPDGTESVVVIDGYKQFSDARYNERIECNVVGKKEDWQGNMKYEIILPDDRKIELESRFVN